jgi:RNA polymerase sigma factor (sigma-70 family)
MRSMAMLPLLDTTDRRIARLMAGDAEAGLGELLRAYGGRVRGYLRKRFRGALSPDRQDEALNEALFRVWQRFDETRGRIGAWFLRMAHQAAVDLARRESRTAVSLDRLTTERAEAVTAASEPAARLPDETVSALYAAIARLSPRQRAVIEADLAEDGKSSTGRLAGVLHAQASSISRSRRRAYRRLRELLSESL